MSDSDDGGSQPSFVSKTSTCVRSTTSTCLSCSSKVSRHKRGKPITGEEKKLVLNLYDEFSTKHPEKFVNEIVVMVKQYSGIGRASIFKILKEFKTYGTVKTNRLFRKKDRKSTFAKLDELQKSNIREKVHELFARKEVPTLNKILHAVNSEGSEYLPNFSRTVLYETLKKLGFQFEKGNRKRLMTDRHKN